VCRSNKDVACAKGFTLHSDVWGRDLQVKPIIVATVEAAVERTGERHFDYIFVSLKCIGSALASAEMIKPAVTSETVIVLIQNGIEIERPYALLFPTNPIVSAVAYISCVQASSAVVTHNDVQYLHIGTYPSNAPESHKASVVRFAKLLAVAGASVQVHDDIQVERWSKALINTAWNPICALSRSGDAQFLASSPDAQELVRTVMLEVAAVAQACGHAMINAELVDRQLGRAIARVPPGLRPSMQVDAMNGRSMEVDAIVGNVVALGLENGVDAPVLKTIHLLVNGLHKSLVLPGQ
jgi:2-dehydropantoate 2-reductase